MIDEIRLWIMKRRVRRHLLKFIKETACECTSHKRIREEVMKRR